MHQRKDNSNKVHWLRRIGLVAGLISLTAMIITPAPRGLTQDAWAVAALAMLMAIWWMSEAIPLAATALAPIVFLPLFAGIQIESVASSYSHPLIFLFLGGFLIARAMERWKLHQFIALYLIRIGGNGPAALIAALMATTAFLSMWISNTAAALVMLPIGQSIIAHRMNGQGRQLAVDNFPPALMLGIAFSATIGGMATLIGTPPNALFAAFIQNSYHIEIGFAQWMAIGLPVVLILLPITWLVLTRLTFNVPFKDDPEGIDNSGLPDDLLTLSRPAKMAAIIIISATLALILRPILQLILPGLVISDATIFIIASLLLFATPAQWSKGTMLLSWEDAKTIRWDVLILFGGGLALASAIENSGLSYWIGTVFTKLDFMPIAFVVLLAMVVVVYLGELASNTAMAAVFLPIAGAAAVSLGLAPLTLVLPVALASSLGFMLPVATPPNAIVFGSGAVTSGQMLKAGFTLDIISIFIVYILALLLGPIVIAI